MEMTQASFDKVLNGLAETIRSGWTWPSPEVGFARYVFEQIDEAAPVNGDRAEWPDKERLDHAPILAATGYLLAGKGRVLRPEWQQAWAEGFDRLSEREAFNIDRLTFAYRPIYVLGIAVGAATCPIVNERGREWVRGVLVRLLREGSTESWADLLHGAAARAVGMRWRERLLVQLDGAAPETLSLLRWLATTQSLSGIEGLSEVRALDEELVRRVAAGVVLPRDISRAAITCASLRRALHDLSHPEESGSLAATLMSAGKYKFDPSILRGVPKGTGVQVTFVAGDQHVGDQFNMRDNIAGAVGRGAAVTARDIAVYKSEVEQSAHIDMELKQKLIQARDEIEKSGLPDGEKQDASDSLKKLTAELDKPTRDPSLVKRYWNRVKEVAPTVASLLASAVSIAKVIHGS